MNISSKGSQAFIVTFLFLGLLLQGCANQQPAAPVHVKSSEYVDITSSKFEIVSGYPRYNMTFQIKKHLPDNAYFLVTFDNPANTYSPIVKKQSAKKKQSSDDLVQVTSRAINKIKTGKPYRTKVELVVSDSVVESVEEYVEFEPEPVEMVSLRARVL